MQTDGAIAADHQPVNVIKNNFEWLLNERDTLESFCEKIQGKTLKQNEDGTWSWTVDETKVRLCNSAGAAYIKTYLESLLTKGTKTTVLDDKDIYDECKRTARDMRYVFNKKNLEFGIDSDFIASLKHMVERFAFMSMRKSKDARMLQVISDTTQQKILQTSVQKNQQEKHGLFGMGSLFKKERDSE